LAPSKVKKMKRFLILLLIPLLVGCGAQSKTSVMTEKAKEIQISIPAKCTDSKVLNAVQQEIPGAVFIDTKWTPAPDTELADILNNGGIACSYGIASAEIGATVRWVLDGANNFDKWKSKWLENGYSASRFEGFWSKKGYVLIKPQSETQEFAIWTLNFKESDVWVSISRTSGENLAAGRDIINAVISQ